MSNETRAAVSDTATAAPQAREDILAKVLPTSTIDIDQQMVDTGALAGEADVIAVTIDGEPVAEFVEDEQGAYACVDALYDRKHRLIALVDAIRAVMRCGDVSVHIDAHGLSREQIASVISRLHTNLGRRERHHTDSVSGRDWWAIKVLHDGYSGVTFYTDEPPAEPSPAEGTFGAHLAEHAATFTEVTS